MIKNVIEVPKGIRFLSMWEDFKLSNLPPKSILNKQIPGCGFTEYCINGPENIILCSPRKMLLENKFGQHEFEVYLVVNELEKDPNVDKDISKPIKNITVYSEPDAGNELMKNKEKYQRLYEGIESYCARRRGGLKGCKILVTYDSYKIVKSILERMGIFQNFYTVVDEFQSILHDARFKSSTEITFLHNLQQSPTALFASATPMMDEYLGMLDEFKDLPYFELDWYTQDNTRVIKPNIDPLVMRGAGEKMTEIIQTYLDGDYEKLVVVRDGRPIEVVSREAVFYVNSVNHIINAIKKMKLTQDQVNILCANTPENTAKIHKKLGRKWGIGKVPLEGEPHKMFTFCTRTVYLGADFYSHCARSFVFSDSNSDCLAVDIAEDLPQILGRQRLLDNPWKNSVTFYYRATADYRKMSAADFDKIIDNKKTRTGYLLSAHSKVNNNEQIALSEKYQSDAASNSYKMDYVAVNMTTGPDMSISYTPVVNNLVLVNELRAFRIQQIDYKDRFTVFSTIHNTLTSGDSLNQEVTDFLMVYNSLTTMYDKLKCLCEYGLSDPGIQVVLGQIADSDEIKSFYLALGPSRLKALGYGVTRIKKELGIAIFSEDLLISSIYSEFHEGDRVSLIVLKERLGNIYKSISYPAVPKATDIIRYFEVKDTMITSIVDGIKKRLNGYKLLKKKPQK